MASSVMLCMHLSYIQLVVVWLCICGCETDHFFHFPYMVVVYDWLEVVVMQSLLLVVFHVDRDTIKSYQGNRWQRRCC